MSDALRQLLAEFVVEVDKAGALKRGNAEIEALKDRLHELQASFGAIKVPAAKAAKTIQDVFARAAQQAQANIAAINAKMFTGGAGDQGGGFFAAGLDKTRRDAEAAANSLGSKLRRGFDRASVAAAAFRDRLATGGKSVIGGLTSVRALIGGLAIGAGARMAKGFIDQIGGIAEASAKLGVTNDEFQRLDVLAKQNGSSVEALGTAFKNLARIAGDPTKESTAAFAALGVSTTDGSGALKSRQDLFFETAGALADVGNETKRAQLAVQLFGRSGTELLPILANGRAGLEAQRAELEKLAVISDANIKTADEFSDKWEVMTAGLRARLTPVLIRLIPVFEGLANRVGKGLDLVGRIATAFDAWAQNSRSSEGAVRALKLGLDALLMPLKLLEDLIVFLAGGESRLGNALEQAFGEGAAASIADGLDALVQGAIDGFAELWAFLTGDQTFEHFGIDFMRVTDDMGAALDRFFEKLGSINQRIQEFLGVDGLVDRVQRLAGFAESPIDALRATVGLDEGTRDRTLGVIGSIGEALSGGVGGSLAMAPGAVAGVSGALAPIQDNRQQSVTVQVGSTAEVAGAVAGAQRGMGRDATAQLAAVSGD